MPDVAVHNFNVYEGSELTTYFDVKQAGSAVDLTGYTLTAQARKYSDDSVVLTMSPTVSDAPAGEITLTITDANADTLYASGEDGLRWDMYVTPSGGNPQIAVRGVMNLFQGQS